MLQRKNAYACVLPEGVDGERDIMAHERIGANVLPYAVEQKDKKYVKRHRRRTRAR